MKTPHRSNRRCSSKSGFTLLEMVIVLGIIAMIMGGAIFAMRGIAAGAKPQQAKADINTFLSTLSLYKLNNNGYPSTAEGLQVITKMEGGPKQITKDPWGRDYVYRFPGKSNSSEPDIICLGADGQEGTDDDIHSKDL